MTKDLNPLPAQGLFPAQSGANARALQDLLIDEIAAQAGVLRRFGLALRLLRARRGMQVQSKAQDAEQARSQRRRQERAAEVQGLSAHLLRDIGCEGAEGGGGNRFERVQPPHWYPPPWA